MDTNISKLIGWMDKFAEEKKPMDLDKFFTYVSFDITGDIVFSKPFGKYEYDKDVPRMDQNVYEHVGTVRTSIRLTVCQTGFIDQGKDLNNSIAMNTGLEMYISFVGYLQWLHVIFANPFVTWLGVLPMGHLFDTTMKALKERQKNPDARPDLVSHWFKGLEKAKKDKSRLFNQRCLESFATANVGAGSDTVSAGLQSFVYHLLRLPNAWQRVRDEIREAQRQGRCGGAVVSFNDAAQLPYLQASIKEAMRVHSPISGT